MDTEKKISKEDTWKSADLRRHLRDGGNVEEHVRRRDENERIHRGGESVERHRKEKERERRRERDRQRESEDTHTDGRREGSKDRREEREEREKERRRERQRAAETNAHSDEHRERQEKRHDREAKERRERERDKERKRDRDKERRRDREGGDEGDRERRREDRDRERRREERDRERKTEEGDRERGQGDTERRKEREREHRGERESRTNTERADAGKERRDDRERRDRRREVEHRKERERNDRGDGGETKNKRDDRGGEGGERNTGRKHSEGNKEERYKDEERERRRKERRRHDENQRHGSESRESRDHRGSAGAAPEEPESQREQEASNHGRKPMSTPRHGDKLSVEIKEVVIQSDRWTARMTGSGDEEDEPVSDKEEAAAAEDHGYEDDFEDYEEDFEDLEESGEEGEDVKELREAMEELSPQKREEIMAIQRAIAKENQRAGTSQNRTEEKKRSKHPEESPKIQTASSQRGKFIDFVAAKQREVSQKAASKQKKRSEELRRLIDLDFSMTFSLLDLPPLSEYDMYIKSFGNSNTKQAYVQCNEDNTDRDVQTEETELGEKWTQHPAERNGACGDPSFSQEAQEKSSLNIDSQRLVTFLHSAAQVMSVLLEEDEADRQAARKHSSQTDCLSFSDGSLHFNTSLPFLLGRPVVLLTFSPVQRHTMMSVHGATAAPVVRLDGWTLICVWNIWEPSRPQKILVYESEVRCCCFSPGKATLVLAGTSIGSVVLWDLRERSGSHYRLKIGDHEWTFRHPTFSTDSVLASSSHLCPVNSLDVLPSTAAGGLRSELHLQDSEDGDESSGLSFQVASLDEGGVLNLWVTLELPKGNDAGSQTDLGLRPGGKVKLLHSSCLPTADRFPLGEAVRVAPLQTLQFKFLPTDSNHFFIGTNMGVVNHGTSHGLKSPPKFYRSQEVGVRPVDVTSISFSPFRPKLFLVGCSDGSVRLHSVSVEPPLAEWRNSSRGEALVSVQWSQTRPSVFCVLDRAASLHVWDLQQDDLQPVLTERLHKDRVAAMAVFGDASQQNIFSGVALAHASGKVQVQYFNQRLAASGAAELDTLDAISNQYF